MASAMMSARRRACEHSRRPFVPNRLTLSKADLLKEIESYRALLVDLMYIRIPARKKEEGQGIVVQSRLRYVAVV